MAMNILKDAQSTIDFATYYPTLCKATSDNDSSVPGYIYEEILKISFLTQQHRVHLSDFLLHKLLNSGWSGKQKIIKLLMQLSTKGHYAMRILLRQKDGELRRAAAQDGPPDPILANTPRLFCNSAIQELLSVLFDPEMMKLDESRHAQGEDDKRSVFTGSGYGSHGSQGKYEGFGSTPINKPDSLVNQVCEMVGKIALPADTKREELNALMAPDSGEFVPLQVSPSTELSASLRTSQMGMSRVGTAGPPIYSSLTPRTKAHVAGRAGGGWESDDEEEFLPSLKSFALEQSEAFSSLEQNSFTTEEEFVNKLLCDFPSWPLDLEDFLGAIYKAIDFNKDVLLHKTNETIDSLSEKLNSTDENNKKTNAIDDINLKILILLLFLEFGVHKELFTSASVVKHFQSTFTNLSNSSKNNQLVRIKAKKLSLNFTRNIPIADRR